MKRSVRWCFEGLRGHNCPLIFWPVFLLPFSLFWCGQTKSHWCISICYAQKNSIRLYSKSLTFLNHSIRWLHFLSNFLIFQQPVLFHLHFYLGKEMCTKLLYFLQSHLFRMSRASLANSCLIDFRLWSFQYTIPMIVSELSIISLLKIIISWHIEKC